MVNRILVTLLALSLVLTGCVQAPNSASLPGKTPTNSGISNVELHYSARMISPTPTPQPPENTQVASSTPTPWTPTPASPTINPMVSTSTPTPLAASVDAFAMNQRLGRGMNLGNALEAPDYEGEWGVTLQESYFRAIKAAGFASVRIPIRWSAHAGSSAPYTIDPAFFARVDWAVQQAMNNQLVAILDFHHYLEMFTDPDGNTPRFLALWQQIANHYKNAPDSIYFELLNEPNGALDSGKWNNLIQQALKVVRQTNPTRMVIIGPTNWNNIYQLPSLQLPQDDRNLIVTFHYYEPFHFTHQGAEWAEGSNAWMGTQWNGSQDEKGAIARDFQFAADWANNNHRPLFLGEFGAYSKADMGSRARYTDAVSRQAEQLGISWAYWEFCSGFGAYDASSGKWVKPLLKALIP